MSFLLALISSCWLGILTSISPCPMATNIAAISFIGKRVGSPRGVFLSGIAYTAGRSLAYAVLALILVTSLLSAPSLSNALQKHMNRLLGPILVLVGMVLADLLRFNFSFGDGLGARMQKHVQAMGLTGALLLGVLFALSFCPVSAALFFGSLLPLSVQANSRLLLPISYGIGTALPVLCFAFLIALGAGSIGRVYERLRQVELWGRRVTGWVFILAGIYLALENIFGVFAQ